MPRPIGHRAKHARDKQLSLVRLTAAEKNQVKKNAAIANLPIAAFVRARILRDVGANEVLADPIPGKRATVKRSALTTAIQRIGVNLRQLAEFVNELGDVEVQDHFAELRESLALLQRHHLESDQKALEGRAGWIDELNNLGQTLNRIVRGSHARGSIAKVGRFDGVLLTIQRTVDEMMAGQGERK